MGNHIELRVSRSGPDINQTSGQVLEVGRDVGADEAARLVADGQAVEISKGAAPEMATAPAAESAVKPKAKRATKKKVSRRG